MLQYVSLHGRHMTSYEESQDDADGQGEKTEGKRVSRGSPRGWRMKRAEKLVGEGARPGPGGQPEDWLGRSGGRPGE